MKTAVLCDVVPCTGDHPYHVGNTRDLGHFLQTIKLFIPEDSHLRTDHHVNLKYHNFAIFIYVL
jgi:hypothetical protein